MHEPIFFYGLLTAVFIVARLVKGVTGMGLPTIAMALLSLGMPPALAGMWLGQKLRARISQKRFARLSCVFCCCLVGSWSGGHFAEAEGSGPAIKNAGPLR